MKPAVWLWLAVLVACLGSVGSLYLSMGMGLKACPLCFYQRSFIMGVFAVLLFGGLLKPSESGLLCLLCLPMAFAGAGVAGFHVSLVARNILECPGGVGGWGSAPLQSLLLFVALIAPLKLGAWREAVKRGPTGHLAFFSAVALGLAFAWLCIASSPPLPPKPTKPYDEPLLICRPPYSTMATP